MSSWYYAEAGQQRGPVSEEQLAQLVSQGAITAETLVWRQGMAGWKPYREVAPGASPAPNAEIPPMPPADPASPSRGGADTPMTPVAAPAGAPAPHPGRSMPFEFTGRTGEYFKIWIVNLLLTVATFGLYAAWAKVRNRRYFYSNTTLLGHAFEYLADPVRILMGNLIVGAAFFAYSIVGALSPIFGLVMLLVFALLTPWIITQAYRFNARNSAWRGLSFHFDGRYGPALVNFVLLPILIPFTLGLIYPLIAKRQKTFVVDHHRYGSTTFALQADTKEFYRLYLMAALFFLPLVFVYGLFIASTVESARSGIPLTAVAGSAVLLLIPAGLSAFVGQFFLRARLFNLVWNRTTLGDHRFEAKMAFGDLLFLQIVNTLAILLSLGLLTPWAKVRSARFTLSCLRFLPQGNVDAFVAASQAPAGALGDAASDFFDIDIGFGA